jgi:hypothetical protein
MMNDNKLDKLLNEAKTSEAPAQFDSVDRFKTRFFNRVQETATARKSFKLMWWAGGVVTAAAALILINSGLSFLNVSQEKSGLIMPANNPIRQVIWNLQKLFPSNKNNLCLFGDEFKTVPASEPGKRNLVISYFLERIDGSDRVELPGITLLTSNNNNSTLDMEGAKGDVWVFSPDDKMVAVDTSLVLKLDDATVMKLERSDLLKIDSHSEVDVFTYNGKKYQLSKVVHRI